MYEVINAELGIKACGLADLTGEQLSSFLNQWEKGATIGSLTLFFEQNTGDLVLNKDNENYKTYLEIAESYLSLPADRRAEAKACCPAGFEETMTVLENCAQIRRVRKEIYRAKRIPVPDDESANILQEIYKRDTYSLFAVVNAFNYGIMQGKRMERAKKKKINGIN